jgi:hypothetical protein
VSVDQADIELVIPGDSDTYGTWTWNCMSKESWYGKMAQIYHLPVTQRELIIFYIRYSVSAQFF